MSRAEEIKKRRTFAIISHPDAGKTTITEQLLKFGGAIREAGTVKARKTGNFAKSDWMDIEKERGISVTSSVMQFDYAGKRVNILDTPGHEDFSEDTYRTLMAVDAAVMVIDSAKGIEAQTKKLFQVVKHRGIPVFTFINKLDRDGREPLDLLSELEEILGIDSVPMNWPIGMGKNFQGLYDFTNDRVEVYHHEADGERFVSLSELADGKHELASNPFYEQAVEDAELLADAGNQFDADRVIAGQLTPVYFGSALTSFGVQTFLESFLQYAPEPHAHKTIDDEEIEPLNPDFSGFVFKIQANMDPRHRDRIAFVRIVSGEFERGMGVNLVRTGKQFKLANVTQFMADTRENVQNAVAGDIIGVYDTGTYQVGDTMTTGKLKKAFEPLPTFTPELFMRVQAKNVMKQKSFHKGIEQLVQEGAIQLYTNYTTGDIMLGAVGQLQFEVFKDRMEREYNADIIMTPMGKKSVRWINPEQLDEKMSSSRNILARDRFDHPLFLFENDFALRWFKDKYPDVELKEEFSV
ncbi:MULTISPECIES: peptide chain release factor 3 [unclassified Lactococcus]|uniref:peptide chain release factor 3 n=1 Tax=unclassified Lactococcus TaxID=2643510 RepID=UPI0011CAFCB3|nr:MULTISPECIES: peptide chain release factor 3 [unclassified Lactococcus]MQW23683.1 peptide chain release factor 3 [Lactococcus sp. dk101]TXK37516.1 peptide chain release factor 3 [Lactococcus sp. dk310]TXK48966.1 peptide chain release factor 3 [Lactococcus sp. dk322]